MKRRHPLRCLTAGFLAVGLAAGCSHNHSSEVITTAPPLPPMVSTVEAVPDGAVATNAPAPPAPPPAIQQATYQQVACPTAPAAPKAAAPAVVAAPAARPAMVQEPKPPLPRGEAATPRRAVVDITASSSFGHANDYCWLSGEVEYSRLGHGWRLRYASVDESDVHGGSVTLVGDARLNRLKDGQEIRVKGHLQHPNEREIAPAYHVDSFEVLNASH